MILQKIQRDLPYPASHYAALCFHFLSLLFSSRGKEKSLIDSIWAGRDGTLTHANVQSTKVHEKVERRTLTTRAIINQRFSHVRMIHPSPPRFGSGPVCVRRNLGSSTTSSVFIWYSSFRNYLFQSLEDTINKKRMGILLAFNCKLTKCFTEVLMLLRSP